MKIRLLVSLAGAAGYAAGDEFETTEKEAISLINAGFAVAVKEEKKEIATSEKVEKREVAARKTKTTKRKPQSKF